MPEALYRHEGEQIDYTPTAALAAGQVMQLEDGRAAVSTSAIAAGVKDSVLTCGVVRLQKTADIALLRGGRVYWDHSANTATYKRDYNSQDFYVGVAVEDVAGSATTVDVALNVAPRYEIDMIRGFGNFVTAVVLTAGTPALNPRGGYQITFSATAEAQKVDMLSLDSIPVESPFIAEFIVIMTDDGDAAAIDVSIGMANATHATDADAITESVFMHLDGNSTQVNLESDDGTTEVAATDSTVDYTLGTPLEVWMDFRNDNDVQIYVDGQLRLSGTTFNVNAATGPWKLLVHAEKTSDDTPLDMSVVHAAARLMHQ